MLLDDNKFDSLNFLNESKGLVMMTYAKVLKLESEVVSKTTLSIFLLVQLKNPAFALECRQQFRGRVRHHPMPMPYTVNKWVEEI